MSVLLSVLSAIYPVLFFLFLIILNVPIRTFSAVIIALALLEFIIRFFRRKPEKKQNLTYINSLFLLAIGVICLIINNNIAFKFYPVLVNIILSYTFGITLLKPPVMIYRFAVLADKTIPKSLGEKKIAAYCRKVTIIWVAFFFTTGSIAAWTALFATDFIWFIYNGPVCGFLTGCLFTCEYIVRKIVQRKIPKAVPLSSFNKNSRSLSHVMCYEGAWSDGIYHTWGDFLKGTSILREEIEAAGDNAKRWILYCEDYWHFLLAFTALLQCKKEIILTVNISPEYLNEIRDDTIPFLTDIAYPEGQQPLNYININSVFLRVRTEGSPVPPCENLKNIPSINKDEASIVLFTSGSTGKPKEVKHRLTEIELDNDFVLSEWGEEIIKRKMCSTVNQHHAYGFQKALLVPFTAGVPFRRHRIEVPDEFLRLGDTEYAIITVPAFLKRSVEIFRPNELNLKSPFIYVSGGVLTPEIAKKTYETFGFWPIEGYGSTETLAVAWRQSKDGIEWTPNDDIKIGQNKEGCLVVRSPYIKGTTNESNVGFETADLVELLPEGRFILKERIDSVVKIEEKRISLTEMEERIIQSGLVNDVCVVAMESTRQYLAAVIVLNEKGKERFINIEKHDINRYFREYLLNYFENIVIPKKWRYLDAIPQDIQGKKKLEEIKLLFTEEETIKDL